MSHSDQSVYVCVYMCTKVSALDAWRYREVVLGVVVSGCVQDLGEVVDLKGKCLEVGVAELEEEL